MFTTHTQSASVTHVADEFMALRNASWTKRYFFENLPKTLDKRILYSKHMAVNYYIWQSESVSVASVPIKFRRAFEMLLSIVSNWLIKGFHDRAMTESTIICFFTLLKERWDEILDKMELHDTGNDVTINHDHGPMKRPRIYPMKNQSVTEFEHASLDGVSDAKKKDESVLKSSCTVQEASQLTKSVETLQKLNKDFAQAFRQGNVDSMKSCERTITEEQCSLNRLGTYVITQV
jgi:hypothetical protein